MSEELNRPMPHAERQALIERLRAEGVDMPDDVKNHVVNGGASAQGMLSAHTQLGFAEEVQAAPSFRHPEADFVDAGIFKLKIVVPAAFLGGVAVGLAWLIF